MGGLGTSELFTDLPSDLPPRLVYPVNLYELVPLLLNEYPTWQEEDLVDFIEEKTRRRVHPEDLISLRAVYRRHLSLEAEFLA